MKWKRLEKFLKCLDVRKVYTTSFPIIFYYIKEKKHAKNEGSQKLKQLNVRCKKKYNASQLWFQ